MKTNTRKLVLNSLLLAIGLLLHQITPTIGLPIQPDMTLIMLFTIIILNKDDYKTSLVCGVITGIFTALTTKFPGGQLPNILDKIITTNIIYVLVFIMYKFPFIKKFREKTQDFIISLIILPIGTLVSGATFLLSALILVGLPGTFKSLFLIAVVPAVLINLVCGLFLIKVVSISVKRIGYKDLKSISK